MRRVVLMRYEMGDTGTFGRLACESFACHALELPWHDNAPFISCIPPGVYHCTWSYSPRFERNLYELADVPGRSDILIHRGNWAGDTAKGYHTDVEGCILLGRLRTVIAPPGKPAQPAVGQSGPACDAFEALLNQEPFDLEITESF